MADPGPVAQTFFVDDDMQRKLRLDSIVTVVDAKHIGEHLDDSMEAKEQIAFADVILLNKTDLVGEDLLASLESRIGRMNAAAKIHRTRDAAIEMEAILDIGGFSLSRAHEIDPKFLEPEYPFEWVAVYSCAPGTLSYAVQPGPDPSMEVVVLPLRDADPGTVEAALMDAVLTFSDKERLVDDGEVIHTGKVRNRLLLGAKTRVFDVAIPSAGAYAFFTEHRPEEFRVGLLSGDEELRPVFERAYKPDHEHDQAVTSVGISLAGDLHPDKFNEWLGNLVRTQGTDIFRMKGVLAIAGHDRRWVLQGVHMLVNGAPDRPWGSEPRHNSIIFIGRNLNRANLTDGFCACLA